MEKGKQLEIDFSALSEKELKELKEWYYKLPVRSYTKNTDVRPNPFVNIALVVPTLSSVVVPRRNVRCSSAG